MSLPKSCRFVIYMKTPCSKQEKSSISLEKVWGEISAKSHRKGYTSTAAWPQHMQIYSTEVHCRLRSWYLFRTWILIKGRKTLSKLLHLHKSENSVARLMFSLGREKYDINNLRLFIGRWAVGFWWEGYRIGWGSEVKGMGEQGERVAGQLVTKQIQEWYSLYSEAWGGRCVYEGVGGGGLTFRLGFLENNWWWIWNVALANSSWSCFQIANA